MFPFLLNFLLWDRNILTQICKRCSFYRHSSTYIGLYLIVNLVLASYELIGQLLEPIEREKFTLTLRFWKLDLTIEVPYKYFSLGRALCSVQALARTLYNILVGNLEALLGLVLFVPIFFAIDIIQLGVDCRKTQTGGEFRTPLWKQSLRLGSTIVFWSNVCCLLYNQYAGCVFDNK